MLDPRQVSQVEDLTDGEHASSATDRHPGVVLPPLVPDLRSPVVARLRLRRHPVERLPGGRYRHPQTRRGRRRLGLREPVARPSGPSRSSGLLLFIEVYKPGSSTGFPPHLTKPTQPVPVADVYATPTAHDHHFPFLHAVGLPTS